MTKSKSSKSAGTITVDTVAPYENATISLTGADPDEDVVFSVDRSGAGTELIEGHTDDTGAATATFVVITPGVYRVSVVSPVHTDVFVDPIDVSF